MSLTWSGDRSREEGGKWTDPISTCSRQPIDFQKDKGITSILQGYTGSFEALTFKVSKEGAEMHVSRRCFFLGLCRLKFWSRAAALGWGVEDRGCSYSRVTGLETPEMDVFCDAVPQVSRGLNHP
ncbi:small integral membrane protein 43 isoform X5 [Tursiops truncatus]|uniref:small integral membrane protein 43 isoform X5 n=1 Tax=Tursiops truncatus TaxID=9739 RepID=UPI003CCF4001